MQMHYFRVEYGSNGKNNKKPLTTALGGNPEVKTKGEGMSKRLKYVVFHDNDLIIHNFLMCQEVFSNILIICDLMCARTIKPTGVSVHQFVFCGRKDALGISDVKRV
jgi:hypothetical protein